MKLDMLISHVGLRALTSVTTHNKEIKNIYAGDRMSDLLCAAGDHTLIVTHLINHGIAKLIELMDVPAICFLNGAHPETSDIESSKNCDACLLVSLEDMYETCGRLYQLLNKS
jgi:hypothetical protein